MKSFRIIVELVPVSNSALQCNGNCATFSIFSFYHDFSTVVLGLVFLITTRFISIVERMQLFWQLGLPITFIFTTTVDGTSAPLSTVT